MLPKSPADLPGYKDTLHQFSDEAMKIVYVEYEMPGPNRMPWSAKPDKDGTFWIPYYGKANKIGHLDPVTGKIEEFAGAQSGHRRDPFRGAGAGRHRSGSPSRAPTSSAAGTRRPRRSPSIRTTGRKHTVTVDPKTGMVWSTGGLSVFDPKTEKYDAHRGSAVAPTASRSTRTAMSGSPSCSADGRIGKVDAKTLEGDEVSAADEDRLPAPHRNGRQ